MGPIIIFINNRTNLINIKVSTYLGSSSCSIPEAAILVRSNQSGADPLAAAKEEQDDDVLIMRRGICLVPIISKVFRDFMQKFHI